MKVYKAFIAEKKTTYPANADYAFFFCYAANFVPHESPKKSFISKNYSIIHI